jgi:hypothetical protein
MIALLPLDERPANTRLPRDVAAIAGEELELPPQTALPHQREAGNTELLAQWFLEAAARSNWLGMCIDSLVFGGLIPARTSADTLTESLSRLDLVDRAASANPELAIDAVSLIMRASNSNSAGEEPLYWEQYGRCLHALGGALHHVAESPDDPAHASTLDEIEQAVPEDVRKDFEHRRLRNHMVNLRAIDLLSQGALQTLLVTSDDTAPYAAGTLEQTWLQHWGRALPREGTLMFYPGADEVGSILVTRALHRRTGRPTRFAIASALETDMARIPAFENAPLTTSVPRQIRAAGGETLDGPLGDPDTDGADVLLVVHAAHPDRIDASRPARGQAAEEAARIAAGATADLVERMLGTGKPVALADVRYTNGSDPVLVAELRRRGVLDALLAYGGWNTAGNTLGSVVAAASAAIVGTRNGSFDETAQKRLLLHRLVEDDVYQSRMRETVRETAGLDNHGELFPDAATEQRAVEQARGLLSDGLRDLDPRGEWRIDAVSFPWHRTFEIDFEVVAAG